MDLTLNSYLNMLPSKAEPPNQVFRFMDLPKEVRLRILEMAIAPDGEIYPLNSALHHTWACLSMQATSHVVMGIGYSKTYHEDLTPSWCHAFDFSWELKESAPPNIDILCVSKQLCDEGLQAAWEGAKRCFIDPSIFTSVLVSRIGVMAKYNVLGRIELSFTNRGWFDFLGITRGVKPTYFRAKPTFFRNESASLGYYLAHLDLKTKLTIRFRDPYDGTWGDPWLEGGYGTTACQRVMIDWILTLAFPDIDHMDINLTGFICKPQRDSWSSILYRERTGRSHHFDHAAAVKAIFETPVEDL
jgi:hypothetical protein